MSTRGQVFQACQPAITAALELAVAERRLPAGEAVTGITDRTTALILAARELTDLVDSMEPGEMPRSWRREREARAS